MRQTTDAATATPTTETPVIARPPMQLPIVVSARPEPKPRPALPEPPKPAAAKPETFDDGEPVPISRISRSDVEGDGRAPSSDRFRAAAMGFGAGLAVVLPLAAVLSGHLDIFSAPRAQTAATDAAAVGRVQAASVASLAPAEVAEQPVRQRMVATAPVTRLPPPDAEQAAASAPAETLRPANAELMAEGLRRIEAGQIADARTILSRAAATGDGEATLALAETFDPNMLAAWNVRGIAPDPGTARTLYAKAAAAGIGKARQRLQALD